MSRTSSSWRSGPSQLAAALRRLARDVGLLAGVAVVDREPVPPPQLARDAPRPDVLHPLEVDARPAVRVKADAPVAHRRDRRLREAIHAHEPLQRDQRLDARARAVRSRARRACAARSRASRPAPRAQRRSPRALPSPSSPRSARPPTSVISPSSPIAESSARPWRRPISKSLGSCPGVILSAPVPKSGFTCSSAMIGSVAPDQRQDRLAPDQLAVALVAWVHRDRGVGEHRLRAHRRDHDLARAVRERVGDPVEGVGLLALLDLEVGDRRARSRVPVDHVVVAVDQPALEQRDEDREDRVDVALVEREALVGEVARRAQPLVLLDDRRAVALAPAPRPLEERLAAELLAARPQPPAARARPGAASRCSRGRCRRSSGVAPRASAAWRISASWIDPLSAWPMCSAPVMFGGGIAIE